MAKNVYTAIDYKFRWGGRDNRPPYLWTQVHRNRRLSLVFCSGRWGDAARPGDPFSNPWGIGKPMPRATCLVTSACFYLTYKTYSPGAYSYHNPPFTTQDGCPAAVNPDLGFPIGDDVGDWARYIVANGLHDFSADLASGSSQGWYAPAVRIDESWYELGLAPGETAPPGPYFKLPQPLWLINFRKPNAGHLVADYIKARHWWADGIVLEYYGTPDWYKNWNDCPWWLDGQTPTQRDATYETHVLPNGYTRRQFTDQYKAGVQELITDLRAWRKRVHVVGQHAPYQGGSYQAKVGGFFRENNPNAWGNRATNIANIQSHRAAIFADDARRRFLTLVHVWHPGGTGDPAPGAYFDERLNRNVDNQAERDSLIEYWKDIAVQTGAFMGIGDEDWIWEGPP